jgi:hypothetical protein
MKSLLQMQFRLRCNATIYTLLIMQQGLQMQQLFTKLNTCRNPSLRLATKARACKSAKECERMNPHILKGTPTLGVIVLMDSWMFKEWLQGSNSLNWGVPHIIGNLLEHRCLNGIAWLIWTFETQVMAKRKVENQIDNLTPDH